MPKLLLVAQPVLLVAQPALPELLVKFQVEWLEPESPKWKTATKLFAFVYYLNKINYFAFRLPAAFFFFNILLL
jgi:hypothetical protein